MIRILSRGFSTIQDAGRYGFRQKGIPCAGVMDIDAYELLNNALGNSHDEAVIEYCKTGLIVEAKGPCQCMVIGQVTDIQLNEVAVKSGQLLTLNTGDKLNTGKVLGGTFGYLGFAGKYKGKKTLGSASESKNILEHEMKDITFSPQQLSASFTRLTPRLKQENETILECYKGPEWDTLLTPVKKQLSESIFHVSRETWRMAFKLQEKIIVESIGIASAPVLPGTVQLTPAGEIIILMRDAQTTGGYPRILQLTEDSINKICRVGWGRGIKFDVYL